MDGVIERRIEAHRWGGSDRRVYGLLLKGPGCTDREGASALGLSNTTYRVQRWRLACSGLVAPIDAHARPRRWAAVGSAQEAGG